MVRGIFKNAILDAGDDLTSPYRMTERFLRLIISDKRFHKYIDAGLDQDLLDYEQKYRRQLFEVPQTVSWEQIIMKLPGILSEIKTVAKKEQLKYAVMNNL
jgi:glucosyl-3-phosphoglycerate synthase